MDRGGSPIVLYSRNRKPRGKGLRTRTGCITCRRRHIKCDEGKPSCGPCDKSAQTCVYNRRLAATSSAAGTTIPPDPMPALQNSDQSTHRYHSSEPIHQFLPETSDQEAWPGNLRDSPHPQTAGALTLDILRESSVASPEHAPLQVISPENCSSSGNTAFTQASPEDLTTRSVASSGQTLDTATARWFGLLAGDAQLEQQALPGPGYEPERDFGTHESPYAADLRQKSPEEQLWQAPEKLRLLPQEVFLFENFVDHISHWIDLFDPTNNFSNFVPHLAMNNTGLMSAILALSVRYLSLNLGVAAEKPYNRNDALQYYYETLHYVQKAMQYDTYKTSLELLATALIISTYEMLDGSCRDWERHLKGVFWIQRSQIIHGDSKGLKQAVWWAWLCQDVWAAFREKRKTLTFWTPMRTYGDLNSYELASRSVYLMAKVVNYCSREETDASENQVQPRIDKAEVLLEMLDEWKNYLTVEFSPLPVDKSVYPDVFEPIWIHPPAFGVALQLNCCARILVLLHRPSLGGLNRYMEQQIVLARCVGYICGIAMTLSDDASCIMSSQCLFIAGMCIQDVLQREAVIKLIDSCRQRTGWPIKSLSEELKEFWDGAHGS